MFELFILLVSNTDNLLVFNVINNNCDFDIIRIKKEHIMCNDLGIYKKYCNSRYQPEEFIIYNEKTVNKKQITIKPYNLIISTNYYKKEIAEEKESYLRPSEKDEYYKHSEKEPY